MLVARIVGAAIERRGATVLVRHSSGCIELPTETEAEATALLALCRGGLPLQEATSGFASAGHLRTLRQLGVVEYVFKTNGIERATLSRFSESFQFKSPCTTNQLLVLSRFAYIRREAGAILLESPEANCILELKDPETWSWISSLMDPLCLDALRSHRRFCMSDFTQLLWRTGFLERSDEAESPSRAVWEFHDLLFHWRSRGGRIAAPMGATNRFEGIISSPQPSKPRMPSAKVALSIPPDSEQGPTLIEVIERRRSVREQGTRPIDASQLSRLLYHSMRIKDRFVGGSQELFLRPVPAAGAIHELEVYAVVRCCNGLEPGLYHYRCDEHALYKLQCDEVQVTALLSEAAEAWAKPDEPPQVVLVLSSRLPRLAWKYQGIAYRLSVLNAGVIMQTWYLLATEMNLACSALGGGDSQTFANAIDMSAFDETSVAEFALGSAATALND